MLLGFLRTNNPVILFLFPIIAFVLLFHTFDAHVAGDFYNSTPIFNWISKQVNSISHLSFFLTLLLYIAFAFYLIRLNAKYIFFESRTYLEAVLVVLLFFGTLNSKLFIPAFPAIFFVLFSLESIFKIDKRADLAIVFNASFWLSAGSLLFFDLIYYIPLLWVSFGILRAISIREWIVSIIGIILPYLFFVLYYYLNNETEWLWSLYKEQFHFKLDFKGLNYQLISLLGVWALFIILAVFNTLSGSKQKKIRTRKQFLIFYLFILVSITLFVITGFNFNHWLISAVFSSLIITNFILQIRSLVWSEILFMVLLGGVLVQYF